MISPTQRPLPDNKQNSQQTDIDVPYRFEPTLPVREEQQDHALNRASAATGEINN